MGRILGIDYGTKRCGIAVSDPLQIMASGLATVPSAELFAFLERYLAEEEVDCIVVGYPLALDGSPTRITHLVKGVVRKMKKLFPGLKVVTVDERFTSKEAERLLPQIGLPRKKRQNKGLVDKLSATLILQDYMEANIWRKQDK